MGVYILAVSLHSLFLCFYPSEGQDVQVLNQGFVCLVGWIRYLVRELYSWHCRFPLFCQCFTGWILLRSGVQGKEKGTGEERRARRSVSHLPSLQCASPMLLQGPYQRGPQHRAHLAPHLQGFIPSSLFLFKKGKGID